MGQSSSSKETARKLIGQSANLFGVIKYGLLGALCLLFGGLFTWAGLNGQFNGQTVGVGVFALSLASFCLWRAYRAWQVLRATSRA